MIDPPLIMAALRRMTAVALADIDSSGFLHDANSGFLRLLPDPVAHAVEPHVADYFLAPRFATLVDISQSGQEPFYAGHFTIGDPDGLHRSLRGTLSRRDDRLLLIAEFAIEELERINGKALQLSSELAEAQRALLSAHYRLQRREEEVRILAQSDPLTGMANRRRLHDVLAVEYARARQSGGALALAMADIDHFKSINDEFGHDVGDMVIRTFASILKERIRATDLAARFGGEEFVVLLPEADTAGAVQCTEEVRTIFAQTNIPPIRRPVTASFGVTTLMPEDTVASLIKRADQALYAAKQGGRNRVMTA